MKTDASVKLKKIIKIAEKIGLKKDELELYGDYKAKIKLSVLDRLKNCPAGKYVDVTAITPTPRGEGKTVTTIGLSLGLNKIGKKVITTLRQPSLGPVFGIKGGASGGGRSQVLPSEDFNLHLTGDSHAVSAAHNLCSAFLDNSMFRGNRLNIDEKNILWRRVLDVSDRSLRNVKTGLGAKEDGIPRLSGFDITSASEVMAILSLASSFGDLRKRVGKIVVAFTRAGKPVTAEDLRIAGAMTVLLKDAVKPNVVQTTEHTACFVHTGPFGNIAHGNSSIIADRIAVKLADYTVTESGFGSDLGMEKFMDIKCRRSGLVPDCVVIVCSVRALKVHSGRFTITAGKLLDRKLLKENVSAVADGICNLEKHIENAKLFGMPVVVAVNRFDTDTDREIKLVLKKAIDAGADYAVVSDVWKKGGSGGVELANAVVKASNRKSKFRFLYDLNLPIKEKIEIIARKIYGAKYVRYSSLSDEKIKYFTKHGWNKLPVCMAKTHLSLSHNPRLKGRPKNFSLPITDIRASVGAGFLYPVCGEIRTIPGLPTNPNGYKIDIDKNGDVVGLF